MPSTIAANQGVPGTQSGLASGLLNTSRLVGGAVGLAVLSTIAAAHTRAETAVGPARSLTDGFALAFAIGVVICLAAAAVAAFLLRAEAGVAPVAATTPATAPEPDALAA